MLYKVCIILKIKLNYPHTWITAMVFHMKYILMNFNLIWNKFEAMWVYLIIFN